jgi:hypothetical protein
MGAVVQGANLRSVECKDMKGSIGGSFRIRHEGDLARYDALSIQERRRIYSSEMSSDERKRMSELRVFLDFAEAAHLPIQHGTVQCFEPPHPDLGCEMDGALHFFELGEVTDSDVARRRSQLLREMKPLGGCFNQEKPLRSIILSKSRIRYQASGAPISLVLYYWKMGPHTSEVQRVLRELQSEIDSMLRTDGYSKIWLYEHPKRILVAFPS